MKVISIIISIISVIVTGCYSDSLPNPGLGPDESFTILHAAFPDPNNSELNSKFKNPQILKDYGFNYNTVIGNNIFLGALISFSNVDNRIIYDQGLNDWMEFNSEALHKEISDNKAAGLKCLGMTDILMIPQQLYEAHQDEITESGRFSIDKPFTQNLIREMVNEIFLKFNLDGIIIRTGELYMNRLIYHKGESLIRTREDYVILINILREEICLKRDKILIFRTWGMDGFHVSASFYLDVTNKIEPHKKLFFSIKHTADDFLRTALFNPTIGIGMHKQIVEFQSQRETEGKGAHPNYIAKSVLTGFTEAPAKLASFIKQRRIAGMFIWSRGGGWAGPHIENELWCSLNTFVMSQFIAHQGFKTEEEIFEDFCDKIGLKDDLSVSNFTKLSLLSEESILYGQYSNEYRINNWWTRDHCLGGIDQLKSTFDEIIANNKVEIAICEKERAVENWKEIVRLSNEIESKNETISDYIKISSLYGFYKYAIIKEGFSIMLLGYLGEVTRNYQTQKIISSIDSYDRLWDEFRLLKENNLNCPSLYHPFSFRFDPSTDYLSTMGMKTSVDRYRYLKN